MYRTLAQAGAAGGFDVAWMNEAGETGGPYDIEVRPRQQAGPAEAARVQYVEVKSTLAAGRRRFPVSVREVVFSAAHEGDYQIVRVFRATTAGAHAEVINGVRALDMEI